MESRAAKNEMKKLAAGTYIVLAGEGDGHVSRNPSIIDCRIVTPNDDLYVPQLGMAAREPTGEVPLAEEPEKRESNDPEPERDRRGGASDGHEGRTPGRRQLLLLQIV